MFVWSARNIGCWERDDSRLFIGRIRTATLIAFSSDMVYGGSKWSGMGWLRERDCEVDWKDALLLSQ